VGLWLDAVDSGLWTRFAVTGPSQTGKSISAFVIPILYHLFEHRETVIAAVPDENMLRDKWRLDLLPVIDSLEKAVESARQGTEGADASASAIAAEAIAEGVELSLKLFLDVLEKAGVSRIHPVGEPFDPQLHEAMAMVENPDAEPNSVLDVMQAGYSLNGRLVRAAMVVVSKAPAEA
jgi:hypothetical protein